MFPEIISWKKISKAWNSITFITDSIFRFFIQRKREIMKIIFKKRNSPIFLTLLFYFIFFCENRLMTFPLQISAHNNIFLTENLLYLILDYIKWIIFHEIILFNMRLLAEWSGDVWPDFWHIFGVDDGFRFYLA